jgi:3-dehydroquinate dehydratase/shikimate dehydrogenase
LLLIGTSYKYSGKTGTKVIVSNHNYESTPSTKQLGSIAAKSVAAGADIVKLVSTAQNITEVARMLQVARSTVPVITLVMGAKGLISRILSPKIGRYLSFGTLSKGQESGSGQPTLEDWSKYVECNRLGKTRRLMDLLPIQWGIAKALPSTIWPLFRKE